MAAYSNDTKGPPSYGQPEVHAMPYGQPPPMQGQPQPSYGQPQPSYSQPQPSYGQPHYPGPHSVHPVMAQPGQVFPVIGTPFLGRVPQQTQCPYCHQSVVTNVQYQVGGGTLLIAFLIFIFGGVFGCCLIPLCVPSCQDAIHNCPSCNQRIGQRNVI